MQAESKPQGQRPQYQRPRIQDKPSRPSLTPVSRRPSTRKPTTYLPSYKDVNVNSQAYKSKAAKDPQFARLNNARPPIRSTTSRPFAHLNRSQGGRQVGTQPASTSKTQLVRPSDLQSLKQSTPRPPRPRRPQSSRKGIPLFSNPAQTIFGAIRTTVKPQRQHARTQLPSRRKSHSTPRGQLARRPKFEESFSEKSLAADVARNIPKKASFRYLPEEKDAKEAEKDEEEVEKYDKTEGTPKESNELQPEPDETEQISDLDDLPGYIVTFRGQDEGENIIDQEDSSEENEELSLSYVRESEEEQQHLRDNFEDPSVTFGLFKPSTKEEETKTSTPDIQEENAEPENPKDIFRPSNQDLTLPGFEPSVAVPNAPVNPAPVSVSSLPRPEPERGPGGFPKLKQGR